MGKRDEVALRNTMQSPGLHSTEMDLKMVSLLDDAPAALTEIRRISTAHTAPGDLGYLAQWAAYFGDPVLSLQLVRRAPRDDFAGRSLVMFPLWLPFEKDVRRLPAFKDFMRELHLSDYWRASGDWGNFCHPDGESDFECS